jgi:hypothetical protein
MMIFKEKDMKKLFRTGFMTALAVILATGWCYAATIMFPYINSNPGNLSTIVNVINTAPSPVALNCGVTETLQLHYRYMTKPSEGTGSAPIDACDERNFYRPSTTDDLVTFDVAGDIVSPNGGEAMFNDGTDYDGGAGAPAFDLPNMGLTDARRGYMLVNHRCSVTGEVPAGLETFLDGEVMLLDLVNGAAWGYRAAEGNQTATGIGPYAFATIAGPNPATGATTELLSENAANQVNQVALYPPDEFLTRFFVTPLIISTDIIASNNMSLTPVTSQKRTRIQLLDANGLVGVTDRDENTASGGGPIHVRCVAGIDLADLTGGGFGAWFDAQGGWAFVDLLDPIALTAAPENETSVTAGSDHCAVVYKLQYGSPSFAGGSMINSCDTIRTDRIED